MIQDTPAITWRSTTLRPGTDVLDLTEIREGDREIVGAKAYHLGLLARAGFAVAKGFCITTHASRNGNRTIRPPLRDTILGAYRRSGIEVAAVRSSALEEDRPDASWAGVYPTILHVRDEQELLEAVQECFRALHDPVATLCRRQQDIGASGNGPAMAVLVQELVDAEAAGILFTVNPLTRAADQIWVNAVPGLGEPLTSGRVIGDTFVVNRSGEIVAQTVTEKRLVVDGRGECTVSGEDRWRPALDCRQLAEVAKVGCAVQAYFGTPQDVEFALHEGRVYVIQARPVPQSPGPFAGCRLDAYLCSERQRLGEKIRMLRRGGKLRCEEAVFSNGNIGELLPHPTPMSFGLFRDIFAGRNGAIVRGRRLLGYKLRDDTTEHLFELIGGQPYFNLEVDAETFNMGVPLDVRGYMQAVAEDPSRANYPEVGLYHQRLSRDEAVACFGPVEGKRHYRTARAFRARMAQHAADFLRCFPERIEPELRRHVEWAGGINRTELCTEALVQHIQKTIAHLKHVSCVHFVVVARIGFYFAEMVRLQLRALLGEEGDQLCAKLLQGLPGSRITEQMIDLERVASGVMSRAVFLDRYGHLAVNELEIAMPRIGEDPGAVDRMLQDLATSGRCPGEEFRQQTDRRVKVETELVQKLRCQESIRESDDLFADLRHAQAFLPLRETVKYYYAAEYALIREDLLNLAARTGIGAEAMFYLYPEELSDLMRSKTAVMERVTARQEERHMAQLLARQKRMPAVIFGSRLESIGVQPLLQGSLVLRGQPVSPGAALGVARVIEVDAANVARLMEELAGDEIIVTRSANLGLAPLLRTVAGLVVEIGGILAHSACQAREAGIPAVVVENATLLLRDGSTIRVDGDRGTVTVVETTARGGDE